MKIRCLFFLLSIWFGFGPFQNVAAQQKTTMPPFKILQTNGSFYTAADLPKGKPVVLIYFAPDCEHCQELLSAVFKKIDAFKKAQLVLVTFKPVSDLPLFERSYGTAKYPNIKVGTEGNTYQLRLFYNVQTTPFTALYDKTGKLVYSYRKEPPVDDLIKRLNSLN